MNEDKLNQISRNETCGFLFIKRYKHSKYLGRLKLTDKFLY